MKKAKIDVLDIADSFDEKPADTPESHELAIEEPHIDLQQESFMAPQQEETAPKKWRFLTWKVILLLGVPSLCLVLAVTAVLVYFFHSDKKTAAVPVKEPQGKHQPVIISSPVYVDDLSSVINDQFGKQKLLLFGFAVTPVKGARFEFDAKDQNVRIAASKIVSAMLSQELLTDKGREQVKKRIKAYIESIRGAGIVETVSITSWVII